MFGSPLSRALALALVGTLGSGAFAATHGSATAAHHRPAAHHAHPRLAPAALARTPWTPTGTGMWIYQWGQTDSGNPAAVLHRAQLAGLSTIYVRTGSSTDGFTGGQPLSALLPRAIGGPAVVAWDFPTLVNPRLDASRLARAAYYGLRHRGWAHVAAVAPDIETPAEGTDLSPARVRAYLQTLRRLLPSNVSILATVPWPSGSRLPTYPYRLIAAHADALLPMDYWYDQNPYRLTAWSLRVLRPLGKPVVPIGQGYDSRVDDPGLPASHPVHELAQFLAAARRAGAPGVSLWSWQLAGPAQWGAIHRAGRLFPGR